MFVAPKMHPRPLLTLWLGTFLACAATAASADELVTLQGDDAPLERDSEGRAHLGADQPGLLSAQRFDAGLPEEHFDAGLPPDDYFDASLPDKVFDAGFPDKVFDAGLPDEGFDAGPPDEALSDDASEARFRARIAAHDVELVEARGAVGASLVRDGGLRGEMARVTEAMARLGAIGIELRAMVEERDAALERLEGELGEVARTKLRLVKALHEVRRTGSASTGATVTVTGSAAAGVEMVEDTREGVLAGLSAGEA